MTSNKNQLTTGVIVFTFFSFLSLPLGYIRNWLLSSINVEFVSAFASINIFIGIVNTFFVFGATNIYSTFLPKIKNSTKQSEFVFSSYINSMALMILMSVIFFIGYNRLSNNLIERLQISNWGAVFFFIFFYGVGQISVNVLIGLREYKLSALLNNLQIFVVTAFLFFIFVGLLPKIADNEFNVFLCLIGFVWCFVFIVFLCYFISHKGCYCRYYLPRGYWSQAIFVHLGTILSFLYGYADQILVLGYLGEKELAQYFLIVQIASLITFLPIRLGNVFQSSFSATLVDESNSNTSLALQYDKIARYMLLLTFSISSFFVLFADEILSIFNHSLKLNSLCFILLVVRYFIGSLGSIHSMIILSKEKNSSFFLMNTYMVIIQLFLSFILVKNYGVFGIIIALILSTIVGQLNLAYLLVHKCNMRHFSISKLLLLFLLLVIMILLSLIPINIFLKLIILIITILIVVKILNIKILYVNKILSGKK